MLTLVSDPSFSDQPAEHERSAGLRVPEPEVDDGAGVAGLLAVILQPRPPAAVFPQALRPPFVPRPGAPSPDTGPGAPAPAAAPAVPAPPAPAVPAAPAPAARSAAAPSRLPRMLGAWLGRVAIAITSAALLASVLMVAVPMALPVQEFAVLTGSMTPTIPVGSLVVDTRVPAAQLKVGDVITFQPPGRPGILETHRIYSLAPSPAGPVIRTKGDANPVPDSWSVTVTGAGWRTSFSVPWLGYVMILAKSELGRLLLIVIPALLLGILYLADLRPGPRRGEAAA